MSDVYQLEVGRVERAPARRRRVGFGDLRGENVRRVNNMRRNSTKRKTMKQLKRQQSATHCTNNRKKNTEQRKTNTAVRSSCLSAAKFLFFFLWHIFSWVVTPNNRNRTWKLKPNRKPTTLKEFTSNFLTSEPDSGLLQKTLETGTRDFGILIGWRFPRDDFVPSHIKPEDHSG